MLQEALQINRSLINIGHLTDQFKQEVCGLLRVSCTTSGRRLMVPLITQFTMQYPEIKIDLRLEDQLVDLISEQIDVAIRISHLSDSSLVARKLADNPYIIVAAPTYLARSGEPKIPMELSDHACVLYANENKVCDTWVFIESRRKYKVKARGVIQINDGDALVAAAVAGVGILMIPRILVIEELLRGDLVPVLSQHILPPGPSIYAVYPERNFLALKTSTFVSFILKKMELYR